MCRSEELSFLGQWDCWVWLFDFVFLVISSELTIQYVMVIYEESFNALLVHFVFLKLEEHKPTRE